jgi:hypothetical protein
LHYDELIGLHVKILKQRLSFQATLKTPKKTTKSLKAAKTKTPGSASASKSKK